MLMASRSSTCESYMLLKASLPSNPMCKCHETSVCYVQNTSRLQSRKQPSDCVLTVLI